MRKIALDLGEKSCGIAISDEMNIIASGMENYMFDQYDFASLVNHLRIYFENYKIDTIVVGYPTFPSGDITKTGKMIDEEIIPLFEREFAGIPIIKINENGSTKKAREILREGGLSHKKQKEYKDKLAAVLILEDYLMRLV